MKNPSTLLPIEFGNLASFRHITWEDFKGEIDETMPWKAHIYWNIQYQIVDEDKKKVAAQLYIGKKSWVKDEVKCDHLLNHQQGHYLIGALCVLEFLRRVDKKKHISNKRFEDLVFETFDRTMKQYLQMQRIYDNETEHRLNYKKQQQWDALIYDKLYFYRQIYDKKKGKFVKLSQSPQKKKKKL